MKKFYLVAPLFFSCLTITCSISSCSKSTPGAINLRDETAIKNYLISTQTPLPNGLNFQDNSLVDINTNDVTNDGRTTFNEYLTARMLINGQLFHEFEQGITGNAVIESAADNSCTLTIESKVWTYTKTNVGFNVFSPNSEFVFDLQDEDFQAKSNSAVASSYSHNWLTLDQFDFYLSPYDWGGMGNDNKTKTNVFPNV